MVTIFLIGDEEQQSAWWEMYRRQREDPTQASNLEYAGGFWALPFARHSVWHYTVCEHGHLDCSDPDHKTQPYTERPVPIFTDEGRAKEFLSLLPPREGWQVLPFPILQLMEASENGASFCINPKNLINVACIKPEWLAQELITEAYKRGFVEGRASVSGAETENN